MLQEFKVDGSDKCSEHWMNSVLLSCFRSIDFKNAYTLLHAYQDVKQGLASDERRHMFTPSEAHQPG
eukprot:19045-Pelagomonas_calceolata.AAC.1